MKKVGFYCCSNGYGHFHRTIQIVEYLKDMDVTIHCSEYQYQRFVDKLPDVNYVFYDNDNIRWDLVMKENDFDYDSYVESVKDCTKNISDFDLVITDNIVEILRYRPDAIYSGSFLWYDVFERKFGKNKFSTEEKKLFNKTKPLVVCNDSVVFGSLKNYKNKLDIGWGGNDFSESEFSASTFCFIVPSLNYTNDYLKKFLEIREEYKNEYKMSFNINNTKNSIFVIRPGLGIINTCVSHKIPMVCLYSDDDSSEIKFLAKQVEKLKIGISLNIKDKLKIKKEKILNMRKNFNFTVGGYEYFSKYLKEFSNKKTIKSPKEPEVIKRVTNNFLYPKLNNLKPFNLYDGEDLLKLLFDAEEYYMKKQGAYQDKNFDWFVDKDHRRGSEDISDRDQYNEFKDTFVFRPPNITNKKDFGYFYYQRKPQKISMTSLPGKSFLQYFATMVVNEIRNKSHGKYIDPDETFYYLKIDSNILNKYLTSTTIFYPTPNTAYLSSKNSKDYKIQKEFVTEVESTQDAWKPNNFIPILEKYDKKYDYRFGYFNHENTSYSADNAPNNNPKWRSRLFIPHYISTKYYGFLYPNLFRATHTEDTAVIYKGGTHRLLMAALSDTDCPFLLKNSLEIKDSVKKHGYFIVNLPPYFDGCSIRMVVYPDQQRVDYFKVPVNTSAPVVNIRTALNKETFIGTKIGNL